MTFSEDPTTRSDRWAALRLLFRDFDADIEQVYVSRGIEGVRPRFAYPLIRLAHTGPLTIRELAASLGLTHSAMSQTLSGMRREGLVTSAPGPDARTRRVALTERGASLVPFLEAEWRATEATVTELDDELAELGHALSAATERLQHLLAERSFRQRILDHLDETDETDETGETEETGETGEQEA